MLVINLWHMRTYYNLIYTVCGFFSFSYYVVWLICRIPTVVRFLYYGRDVFWIISRVLDFLYFAFHAVLFIYQTLFLIICFLFFEPRLAVCVGFVMCVCACKCGFCNVWVCICVGFVMYGCVCMCRFCNALVCVCVVL